MKAFNSDLSGGQVKTNKDPEDYWFDHRIHTLGNSGISGAIHAALATVSTKLIDILAYDGVDIRNQVRVVVHHPISNLYPPDTMLL